MLVPLIKHLRASGTVTCFASSPFHSEKVFEGFADQLFEEVVDVSTNSKLAAAGLQFRNTFEQVYLDYFAGGRKQLLMAQAVGRSVFTNRTVSGLPSPLARGVSFRSPVVGIHEGVQNLRLAIPDASEQMLDEEHFRLLAKPPQRALKGPYITVQPGTGNNKTPWKTWPADRWQELLKWLISEYQNHQLVLLGDNTEEWINEALSWDKRRVQSLIGTTSLQELPAILEGAALHIGGDSGLMHIAGCVGTSTVTVWGGSDPELFGWKKINPQKHHEVRIKDLDCHPCNRWIEPNTSKASEPGLCPDFRCIRDIDLDDVTAAISNAMAKIQS